MSLPAPSDFKLQEEYDFVIVGSGGGSMAAALLAKDAGLDVCILEKLDRIGGSTGYSGGVWWIPNSHVMRREGVEDSAEEAHKYFESVVFAAGRFKGNSDARVDTFIDQAPKMAQYLESKGMEFYYPDGWADYYDSLPGGNSRTRSLMAQPFDLNRLGPWKEKLSLYEKFKDIPIPSFEAMGMMMYKRTFKAKKRMAELMFKMAKNKLLGRAVTASGGAIQSRMLEMTLKNNIPVFTGFATDKLVEEDGRVVAVEGMYEGKRTTVRSRSGILINAGGFSRNQEMRDKYQRKPIRSAWSNSNWGDTGEMIEEMMRLGAETENLDTAVWVPTSLPEDLSPQEGSLGKTGEFFPFMHNADLGTPNMMMVGKDGKRYINEGQSYMEMGEKMYELDKIPTFFVFDQHHMERYPLGPMMAGMKPVKKWIEQGYLIKADTIEELAEKAGIDKEGLVAQVERMNHYAKTGIDEEFHKGERQYDRFRGDPTIKPNPCLGPIDKAPFYAVRMYPGDVGTFGGVVTDERARVLREDGSVIEGLYATGNSTSSVMGRTYPGAGASISPSFTFGWLAAKDVIERRDNA